LKGKSWRTGFLSVAIDHAASQETRENLSDRAKVEPIILSDSVVRVIRCGPPNSADACLMVIHSLSTIANPNSPHRRNITFSDGLPDVSVYYLRRVRLCGSRRNDRSSKQ
jgi:hypothetical protein